MRSFVHIFIWQGSFFMPPFLSSPDTSTPAFQRFFDALPDRPRATDYLEVGLLSCSKITAIKRRYIQFNKKNYSCKLLTYDCDHEGPSFAWDDANLPAPTIIAINRANGHAHLTYELEVLVHLGGDPSRKVIYYLEIIHDKYTNNLGPILSNRGINRFVRQIFSLAR